MQVYFSGWKTLLGSFHAKLDCTNYLNTFACENLFTVSLYFCWMFSRCSENVFNKFQKSNIICHNYRFTLPSISSNDSSLAALYLLIQNFSIASKANLHLDLIWPGNLKCTATCLTLSLWQGLVTVPIFFNLDQNRKILCTSVSIWLPDLNKSQIDLIIIVKWG